MKIIRDFDLPSIYPRQLVESVHVMPLAVLIGNGLDRRAIIKIFNPASDSLTAQLKKHFNLS